MANIDSSTPVQPSVPEINVLEFCNDGHWYPVKGVRGCSIGNCPDCGNTRPFEPTVSVNPDSQQQQTFYVIRAHPHDRKTLDYAYQILLSNFDDVVLSKILCVFYYVVSRWQKSNIGDLQIYSLGRQALLVSLKQLIDKMMCHPNFKRSPSLDSLEFKVMDAIEETQKKYDIKDMPQKGWWVHLGRLLFTAFEAERVAKQRHYQPMVLTFYFPRGVNECKPAGEQEPRISPLPGLHPGFLNFPDVERNIVLSSDWASPVAGSHYCFQHHQWFQRLFAQCAHSTARETQAHYQSTTILSSQAHFPLESNTGVPADTTLMSYHMHESDYSDSSSSERTGSSSHSCSPCFTATSHAGGPVLSARTSDADLQRSWSLSSASDSFCLDSSLPASAQTAFDGGVLEPPQSVTDWTDALARFQVVQSSIAEQTPAHYAVNWLADSQEDVTHPSSPVHTCGVPSVEELTDTVQHSYIIPTSPFSDLVANSQRQLDISAVGATAFGECFRNVNRTWAQPTPPAVGCHSTEESFDDLLAHSALSIASLPQYGDHLTVPSVPVAQVSQGPSVEPTQQYPSSFQTQLSSSSTSTRRTSLAGSCCVHDMSDSLEVHSPVSWSNHPGRQLYQPSQVEAVTSLVPQLHAVQSLGLNQLADAAQAAQMSQPVSQIPPQPRATGSHPNFDFVQSSLTSKCTQNFPESSVVNTYSELQWPNFTTRMFQPLPSQFNQLRPPGSSASSNTGYISEDTF